MSHRIAYLLNTRSVSASHIQACVHQGRLMPCIVFHLMSPMPRYPKYRNDCLLVVFLSFLSRRASLFFLSNPSWCVLLSRFVYAHSCCSRAPRSQRNRRFPLSLMSQFNNSCLTTTVPPWIRFSNNCLSNQANQILSSSPECQSERAIISLCLERRNQYEYGYENEGLETQSSL